MPYIEFDHIIKKYGAGDHTILALDEASFVVEKGELAIILGASGAGKTTALAFVVLFTLSTTNISERCRELATIKVLGFFDREVHLYVNKETLILSCIGIALGIPAGMGISRCMGLVLHIPGIYYAVSIHHVSYLICAVIALAFALIVNQITKPMLNEIDPVEALKSVE